MHTIYIAQTWPTQIAIGRHHALKNDLSMVSAWICKLAKLVTVPIQCHYTGTPNMCIYDIHPASWQKKKPKPTTPKSDCNGYLVATYELSSFAWIIATILTKICSAWRSNKRPQSSTVNGLTLELLVYVLQQNCCKSHDDHFKLTSPFMKSPLVGATQS